MQVGAMFGIIFALIVMAFVILFGTGQINNMLCTGSMGQTSKTIRNLEIVVGDIQASGEGSGDIIRLSLPENARVCFVNPDNPSPSILGDWMPDPNLFIEEEIQSNSYNMWIEYGCGVAGEGYDMHYVYTNSNFCAIKGDRLLLTNTGIEVSVQKVE